MNLGSRRTDSDDAAKGVVWPLAQIGNKLDAQPGLPVTKICPDRKIRSRDITAIPRAPYRMQRLLAASVGALASATAMK
jgi:hypothetical protein